MNDKPDTETDCGWADPSESEVKERQQATHGQQCLRHRIGQQALRQSLHQVKHGRRKRKARGPGVDRPVVAEQPPAQCQQNQGNSQRIEEHQHRNRIRNDGVESERSNQERQHTEADRPHPVGRALREHGTEAFAAAGNQSDRRLQAGQSHDHGQNDGSRILEIVAGHHM